MTTPTPLYTFGDNVLVDEQKRVYITNIRGEVGDLFFKVHYIIEKTKKSNVTQSRCRVVSIYNTITNTNYPRVIQHYNKKTHINIPQSIMDDAVADVRIVGLFS